MKLEKLAHFQSELTFLVKRSLGYIKNSAITGHNFDQDP